VSGREGTGIRTTEAQSHGAAGVTANYTKYTKVLTEPWISRQRVECGRFDRRFSCAPLA